MPRISIRTIATLGMIVALGIPSGASSQAPAPPSAKQKVIITRKAPDGGDNYYPWPQVPAALSTPQAPAPPTPPIQRGFHFKSAQSGPYGLPRSGGGGEGSRMKTIEELWQKAESKEEKQEIERMLVESLEGEFDANLQERKEELKQIVQRVEKLKAQLQKRIDSRDSIVQLQAKQVVMSLDGLGWSGRSEKTLRENIAVWVQDDKLSKKFPFGLNNSSVASLNAIGALIVESAKNGDTDRLLFLANVVGRDAKKLADTNSLNVKLWEIYETVNEHVDSEDFWMALANVAEEHLKSSADARQNGNFLDTAAHLFEKAGNAEKALKFQQKAVEQNPHSQPLIEYMQALEGKVNGSSDSPDQNQDESKSDDVFGDTDNLFGNEADPFVPFYAG